MRDSWSAVGLAFWCHMGADFSGWPLNTKTYLGVYLSLTQLKNCEGSM